MINIDLELAYLTNSSLHIPHVSSSRSIEHIRVMKRKNNDITVEVTPHHLFFTDEDLTDFDTNLKVAPPIRSNSDRKALINAVKDGTINCIATDHAPHTSEEKEKTFDLAPFGMIGLESCFGVVNKVLVKENKMKLDELIQLLTCNPRKILGFNHDLFKPGIEAEIAVIDANKKWVFSENDIFSKSKNSPFIGKEMNGKIVFTIAKGHLSKIE